MTSPIDLLKIASERLQVNWEVYLSQNKVICDHLNELYMLEIESYDKAIKILDGTAKKEADAEYQRNYHKYLKNKNARRNEIKSHKALNPVV